MMRTKNIAKQLLLLTCFLFAGHLQAQTPESFAIFYGANPPVNALAQFDRLALESENVTAEELQQLKTRGAATFAYLSVGEVNAARAWHSKLQREWIGMATISTATCRCTGTARL